MWDLVSDKINDPQFLISAFAAIAAVATVLTLAMPLIEKDTLAGRMKSVASERDRIRMRERDRLAKTSKVALRQEEKPFMKSIVEQFKLSDWLGTEGAKAQLASAGFRGAAAETAFVFFRGVIPIGLFMLGAFYLFVLNDMGYSVMMRIAAVIFLLYIGIKVPEIFLKNIAQKRQFSMRRAFPDSLDLMLICVESGMSIEHAFRKVADEIGPQSIPLAEELTLTTAELSFLPDRRQAYENLGKRTGVDAIRQVVTVLNQAEKYGTPLGTALRVVSQESRDTRMAEAEKKAASLPPKLTVPMILFFLPVLFAVILTPAIIQITATFGGP
ncbi:MAG: type II secretion system F family protein [Beijerinckiaceae bacterium]|nr:type II secretion system F family protein [Beijerinckiaceae bacterium]